MIFISVKYFIIFFLYASLSPQIFLSSYLIHTFQSLSCSLFILPTFLSPFVTHIHTLYLSKHASFFQSILSPYISSELFSLGLLLSHLLSLYSYFLFLFLLISLFSQCGSLDILLTSSPSLIPYMLLCLLSKFLSHPLLLSIFHF